MTREETVAECKRVKQALRTTKSEKLKKDYTKYLQKLQRKLLNNAV